MKEILIFVLLSVAIIPVSGKKEYRDSVPNFGKELKNSTFFRDYYHYNDFVHYLDNLNDLVTYQSETTGNFNLPDQLIFSVAGNSHRWNKFYLDGFRTDSRFFAGSTFYQPDLYNHSLEIDYFKSGIYFESDSFIPNSVSATYNVGGIGGVAPGTKEIIHIFHKTAYERFYKPVEYRNRMQGAGIVRMDYSLPVKGKNYAQHLYVDFGQRRQVGFDETGINRFYPENFFKINMNGQLPWDLSGLFDDMNYLFHISQRDHLYSEFYYGEEESPKHNAYSLSLYGTKKGENYRYTSGLTWATNHTNHDNLNFSRNVIDQDGEGFEPWSPDGNTTELSYFLGYRRILNSWLHFSFEGYNSVMYFNPEETSFYNPVYMQKTNENFRSLYVYEWESRPFWSGLLENTASLQMERRLASWLNFKANADFTFDAMILSGKSMVRPNWQLQAGFHIEPVKWFSMELNFSRSRVSYNIDDIRYFSDRYLNGNIYYWQDNGDGKYQTSERGSYFTSTGGKNHTAIPKLRQPSYWVIDLPLYFRFGRHQFTFLNSFRKYYDNWITMYDGDAEQYGYFDNSGEQSVFFLKGGAPINYKVGYYPEEYMEDGSFLTNSPYYMSSVIKYQYTSPKFLFSLSWQSYMGVGISTLGNGPLHNNMGALSESTANPNSLYKLIGRLDQDRAYILRSLITYNVNKHVGLTLNIKFKDGQPFSSFLTRTATDADGNTQIAIWDERTKGINPFNGDFGSREDAFFNLDFRATYRGEINRYPFEAQFTCYNFYDFGTELTEYTFVPAGSEEMPRYAMSQCIPRGFLFTFKIGLSKNR